MFYSQKLFNIIVSNVYENKKNNNLSDIRKYYNTISINNKIRIDRFSNIL